MPDAFACAFTMADARDDLAQRRLPREFVRRDFAIDTSRPGLEQRLCSFYSVRCGRHLEAEGVPKADYRRIIVAAGHSESQPWMTFCRADGRAKDMYALRYGLRPPLGRGSPSRCVLSLSSRQQSEDVDSDRPADLAQRGRGIPGPGEMSGFTRICVGPSACSSTAGADALANPALAYFACADPRVMDLLHCPR